MYGVINIGGKDVAMNANAATPIRYRQVFGENILPYFMGKASEEDAAEMVGRLAYIMAKSADGTNMSTLNQEDYVNWLEGFGAIDFMDDMTVSAILDLYQKNGKTQTELKKNPDQPNDK